MIVCAYALSLLAITGRCILSELAPIIEWRKWRRHSVLGSREHSFHCFKLLRIVRLVPATSLKRSRLPCLSVPLFGFMELPSVPLPVTYLGTSLLPRSFLLNDGVLVRTLVIPNPRQGEPVTCAQHFTFRLHGLFSTRHSLDQGVFVSAVTYDVNAEYQIELSYGPFDNRERVDTLFRSPTRWSSAVAAKSHFATHVAAWNACVNLSRPCKDVQFHLSTHGPYLPHLRITLQYQQLNVEGMRALSTTNLAYLHPTATGQECSVVVGRWPVWGIPPTQREILDIVYLRDTDLPYSVSDSVKSQLAATLLPYFAETGVVRRSTKRLKTKEVNLYLQKNSCNPTRTADGLAALVMDYLLGRFCVV